MHRWIEESFRIVTRDNVDLNVPLLTLSLPMQKRYFVICWIYCTYNSYSTPSLIIYHLKDINECRLWITSPNKKEVIVLIKMDLKYKKQNV